MQSCSWLKLWLHHYDAIRSLMGFSLRRDLEAAAVMESLMRRARAEGRYVKLESLCSLVSKRTVCIVGLSRSVYREASYIRYCSIIVAADGATTYLLEQGIKPHMVFTDLDGRAEDLLQAVESGSTAVVHAHGDNIDRLVTLVPRFTRVHGTVQAWKPGLQNVTLLGGFTDGDRAFTFAVACSAKRVLMLGMRFWDKVSRYSKPWLDRDVKPWPQKRLKLVIAARLVAYLYRLARLTGVEVCWPEDDEGVLCR